MPFINLSDNLLDVDGLLKKLTTTQSELANLCDAIQASSALKKINSIKGCIKKIYFEGMDEQAIKDALLPQSAPFNPAYRVLQQVLSIIFSGIALEAMITEITALPAGEDWTPNADTLARNYERLQQQHGYFQAADKTEGLQLLFKALVSACRKITVLIEKNNTPQDTMAYDYAYKLMAILVDENKPLPSFNDLSKKIKNLLAPKDKAPEINAKPFHDALLDLKLPDKAHDKAGWMALINKEGAKILPFFAMVIKLEEKTNHKAPKTIGEAKNAAASLLYNRYSDDEEFSRLCYDYKVPEETFNAGLDFIGKPPIWPKKQTDFLPDVLIEATSSNYAWTKLPTDDKRGLILGKITDCCQSIGDHSGQCVQDAASLNGSGLYVLLKRKKSSTSSCKTSNGSINYGDFQIIGQSYAWISKTGNLCLDSVECLRGSITTEQLKEILIAFAEKALESNPAIKRVTLGMGGKTPQGLFPIETPLPEAISEGLFYGDASRQYLIARQPSRLTEEQIQVLNSRYQTPWIDRLLYLAEHVDNTTDFPERIVSLLAKNPSLAQTFSTNDLFTLLRFTKSPTINDLEPVNWTEVLPLGLSTAQLMWQADTLDKKIIALAYIPSQDRIAAVKDKDHHGNTILHLAGDNPESIKTILELYPESDRVSAVKEKDYYGSTVLHLATENPESLKIILALYPEYDRLAALKAQGRYGKAVLHRAVKKNESLKAILESLPEHDRLAAVKEKDYFGNTILHLATQNPESLKTLLELYPESDRFAAVKEIDRYGNNVLHLAAKIPESLKVILESLPEGDRLTAVKEIDRDGDTILYLAAKNPLLIRAILALMPESDRLTAVKEKGRYGHTALQLVAENPELFKAILELLPETDRLAALNDSHIILHLAAKKPKLFKAMLELLPESDRLAAVNEKDIDGHTVLHLVAANPELLKAILELLPETDRVPAVKEKYKDGPTVLHLVVEKPELLKAILELLPESDRLDALKEKNQFSETVLHLATQNPDSLKAILERLPESDRVPAVKEKDRSGRTVLHLVADNPELLKAILALYPETDRVPAVKEKDKDGRTVLHLMAENPELLKTILALYPESERLAAVKERDKAARTVLHLVAENLELLKAILELLPESDRVPAVKDRNWRSVLHLVAENPDLLKEILALLPESYRVASMKEKDRGGDTFLHLVAANPELLKAMLELLPESDRLPAVKEKDRYGRTVLHLAAENPESLMAVLEQHPESDRLAAVKEKDAFKRNVLNLVAHAPELLSAALGLLTMEQLISLKHEENGAPRSVTAEIDRIIKKSSESPPATMTAAEIKDSLQEMMADKKTGYDVNRSGPT